MYNGYIKQKSFSYTKLCIGLHVVGKWVDFFAILCSRRISLFQCLTSDVNTVTLVLQMILAGVKCRQKPLEIEGYCILSREVKIQKQKTIKPGAIL